MLTEEVGPPHAGHPASGVDEQPSATSRRPLQAVDLVAVLAATALAAGFVLYQLGTKSIWVDEGATVGTASQHGAALWHWLVHDGGNMLGYYAAMHVWVGVFGSSPESIRLPTALSLIATVPCSFFLMRRLFDRRAAVMSAFLVAVSSPLVYWGQEARGYVPAVFFVVAAALALVVAVQDGRRAAWAIFVACSVLAAYMVLLAGLVIVAQLLALAFLPRRQLDLRRIGMSCLAIVLLCVPLGLFALHRGTGQLEWIAPATRWDYLYYGRFLLSAPASLLVTYVTLAVCLLAVVMLVRRVVRCGRSPEAFAAGFLVSWAVVPVVLLVLIALLIQPVLVDRYFLPMIPAVAMLCAAVLSRLRPAPLAWSAAAVLVALHAWVVPPDYGSEIENWKGPTSLVVDNLKPHDCIAFFVSDGFTEFAYYLDRMPEPHPAVPAPILPSGASYTALTPYVLDPATIPASSMPHVVATCSRIWLVLTHQEGDGTGGTTSYQVAKQQALRTLTGELTNAYKATRGYRYTSVFVALYVRTVPAAS